MSDITTYLKAVLKPGGSAPIVPIGWHMSTSRSAFYDKEFVDECIDEIDRVIARRTVDEPSALERLAIQLLLESAYVESIPKLIENAAAWKTRQNVTV